MEDLSKYLGINWTFFLICCMFWIFSPAEGNSISREVGSPAILHCNISSNSTLNQLTLKMNRVILFSFSPIQKLYIQSKEAKRLNINISASHPYALVIERVEKSHEGNYTFEITTEMGVEECKWELQITEEAGPVHPNKLMIVAAVVVPCVCCLIFILALIILYRCHKQRAENCCSSEMQPEENIYENCLESDVIQQQQHGYIQPLPFKTRSRPGGVQY